MLGCKGLLGLSTFVVGGVFAAAPNTDAWRATGEEAFVTHRTARMALVAKPADPL